MEVITVARPFGAGGRTLCATVAKRLGYLFMDDEIIQMMAEKANVSPGMVDAIEKDSSGKLRKFLSGLNPKSFLDRLRENREAIDEEIYVDLLYRIVGQIAREGNVVILGRGGQYILKDYPDAFHVLLAASADTRRAFLAKHYHLSADEADRAIGLEDRRRANLYRRLGREDYDRCPHYHLILNMNRLSMETASELVCELVRK